MSIFFVNHPINSKCHLRGCVAFLEIVFVGQCEVFVCLDFVHFFFFLGREAHRSVNSLKKCIFFC